MNYSPTNTASQFTTKLNEVVELDGNWEVGLLEASFPGKVENVTSNEFYYHMLEENGNVLQCPLAEWNISHGRRGDRSITQCTTSGRRFKTDANAVGTLSFSVPHETRRDENNGHCFQRGRSEI